MTSPLASILTVAAAFGFVTGSIIYQEIAHPKRCTLYEQYTRSISDTVDGPFKPRLYVRCIQEERE
jgi:hypothetical protein